MKKNLWISVLIVAAFIITLVILIKPDPSFFSAKNPSEEDLSFDLGVTREEAEAIAAPWFHKCFDNQYTEVVSYTSLLMTSPWPEDEGLVIWRVGGNYINKDFDPNYVALVENYGDSPEVLIEAETGKIYYKHFQDIGENFIPECNN